MTLSVKKRILFSGGGTAGSVSPLLAIYDRITSPPTPLLIKERGEFEFFWIGTKNGIEREMVKREGIPFKAIYSGKLRRYFSLKNFSDIFFLKLGFFQSLFIMLKWRPDLVMSAGGFVSVPVVFAAWVLRVPALIHQQDVRPGLANKIMAPFAKVITVTFEKSLKDYGEKAAWVGNPARKVLTTKNSQLKTQNFFKGADEDNNLPVLLIVSGGTGAMFINNLVAKSKSELTKFCQVIHVTGKNKIPNSIPQIVGPNIKYHLFEFLPADKMAEAMKKADLVITRAGMSFLTELSFLGKPAIIIPIPDSHQTDNARVFLEREAAVILEQKNLDEDKFVFQVKSLLTDVRTREKLSANISRIMKPGANEEMLKIISRLLA
ncbi:MAG: UDP-N-acetylglucosamine--N-acetylmuramyl-(pentapeptide) pyrophosphoryl-undecaprenol N-acetylglucosamine transferase [Patescibacteria group bacterium]|jgi:UDP-N-acetylglucosamine--N-acetylmuramyl-(pentapeptide) pyrophosphoryl-undecaprenol N-acetylglucosamine transferase